METDSQISPRKIDIMNLSEIINKIIQDNNSIPFIQSIKWNAKMVLPAKFIWPHDLDLFGGCWHPSYKYDYEFKGYLFMNESKGEFSVLWLGDGEDPYEWVQSEGGDFAIYSFLKETDKGLIYQLLTQTRFKNEVIKYYR